MRADAVRNRAAILSAAQTLMTDHGVDVGMGDIAAAAGVAVGTLYRHFPAKTDLVAAVLDETLARMAEDIEAAAHRVAAGADSGDALAGLFRLLAERQTSDRASKAAAAGLGLRVPTTRTAAEHPAASAAHRAITDLLRTADAAGRLAAPTGPEELVALLEGVPDSSESVRSHYVETVLRGLLRPPSSG